MIPTVWVVVIIAILTYGYMARILIQNSDLRDENAELKLFKTATENAASNAAINRELAKFNKEIQETIKLVDLPKKTPATKSNPVPKKFTTGL